MNASALDFYTAACDAENGFDSGALDRLTGNDGSADLDDDDLDDFYTPEELRAMGRLPDDD